MSYNGVIISAVEARQKTVLHFCAAYSAVLVLSALVAFRFHANPPPRYGDLYLPLVALICARYSWKAAAPLFVLGYLTMLLALLPLPADRIFGYTMFGLTGAMTIFFVEMAKKRRAGDDNR